MIPCPHCDREFEKRSGLMRHVQATHPDTLEPVPVNPGGAIEPVVPVETYAESLDDLEPGQEPYVDPPVEELVVFDDFPGGGPAGGQDQVMTAWFAENVARGNVAVGSVTVPDDLYQREFATTPVRLTMDPTPEQRTRIRQLQREGVSRWAAWMTIVGHWATDVNVTQSDSCAGINVHIVSVWDGTTRSTSTTAPRPSTSTSPPTPPATWRSSGTPAPRSASSSPRRPLTSTAPST
jgi:hypothetical protein